MGAAGGVEIRDTSIRIHFTFDGKAYKKTLKTDGKPIAPTAGNIRYAHRLADEIRQKIRFGHFRMADYFADTPDATSGHATTVADRIQLWLKLQTDKTPSSQRSYAGSAQWWIDQIGDKPITALRHSDILAALATRPDWSGKTRNGKASVLRRVIQLALRDGIISADPIAGLEPASHQKAEPDPFSVAEAETIIAHMAREYGPQVSNYFGFKFFSGLRTSESLGLKWNSVDWPSGTATVREGIVLGQHKATTKTKEVRQVQLNTRALAFLQAQKPHTFLRADGWVFLDPRTGQRYADDAVVRDSYWAPTLKRLGLRYRSPYQTRHTYATMLLMAGVTPAYAARQMGHSIQMFLSTYARWLDGGQNAVEMGKLETLLGATQPQQSRKSA